MSPRVRECTPRGGGAISVLRIEGRGTRARLAKAWPRLGRGTPPCFARVRLQGREGTLDDALVILESEDAVELCLHGSAAIVVAVRGELERLGVRWAEGGADGGADEGMEVDYAERCRGALAEAATLPAARMLLDQAEGALERELREHFRSTGAALADWLGELRLRARVASALMRPSRVVLAGPVNAGKSTLFNALVGRERAVVSGEAGTTRDAVGERVRFGAYPVEVFDAAGERSDAGSDRSADLERAGQRRALELQGVADLVVRLEPRDRGPAGPSDPDAEGSSVGTRRADGVPVVVLRSQDDDGEAGSRGISALHRPIEAVDRIEGIFHAALELPAEPWIPGQGVPIESRMMEEIERWAALPAGEPRAATLHRLLGPPSPLGRPRK